MSLSIGRAIYSILTGNTSLSTYIDSKIYPIFAPDEVLVPFIVYERRNITPFYTKDGLYYDEVNVVIYIVSDDYSSGVDISNLVRASLEKINGTYSGVNIYNSELANSTEDFGVDGFIQTLEFNIRCS